MRKSPVEKAENRMYGFAVADKLEWQRILENPNLLDDVEKIQDRFGLPVQTKIRKHLAEKEVGDWMGWSEPLEIDKEAGEIVFGEKGLRREKLAAEEKKLAVQHSIPPKFYSSLHRMIVLGVTTPDKMSFGLPTFRMDKGKDGKFVHECIVTPETDLDNPFVLDFIKQWQAGFSDEIPIPQPMRDNSRRLDWRPVWEWRKRHPQVSITEIADRLGKNRVTVSRALERLDKEYPLQM